MTDLNVLFAKQAHPDRHLLGGYIEARTGLPKEPAQALAADFLDRFIVLERAQATDPKDIELARLHRLQERDLSDLIIAIRDGDNTHAAWAQYRATLNALLAHAGRK